jgi:lipopolysaccharide/colanic/teichoic acid biosynthesis glycosyltransferase
MASGLTQISGRNVLIWEEKFLLGGWSLENRNLWFHTKILCMAVGEVVRRGGINLADKMSTPAFTGSNAARDSD